MTHEVALGNQAVGDLRGYADIPSRFESGVAFEVIRHGDVIELVERTLQSPSHKDYDRLEDPLSWPSDFDTSRWTRIDALRDGVRLGCAIVAFDTPSIHMLEGRRDLAVLWDIRVAPASQRAGIGRMLFRAAEAWALAQGCTELKVETQNVNVAACRFYRSQGCRLSEAIEGAYPALPQEVQLIWRKQLAKQE